MQLVLIPLQSFVVLLTIDGVTNHIDCIPVPQIIYEEKSNVWINVSLLLILTFTKKNVFFSPSCDLFFITCNFSNAKNFFSCVQIKLD